MEINEEVEDLWHAVSDLEETVAVNESNISNNAEAIIELEDRVDTNEGDIDELEGDVGALETAVDPLVAAALIEDYFFVNEEDTDMFPRNSEDELLVPPFCITEPGVLIFNLAVNYASNQGDDIVPNVRTKLLIDDVVVAESRLMDEEEPNNVALFYEGEITDSAEVKVTVSGGRRRFFVEALQLQWGYRLYGEGYNLITEPDTSCVMMAM